ncbi:hypothetical protein [Mesorhizobium japonicum]|uniref:hypothetical protein n=1 Tax=Mesorhizobium japonicum TaxID=2066070 RepID=UPI003B5C9D78
MGTDDSARFTNYHYTGGPLVLMQRGALVGSWDPALGLSPEYQALMGPRSMRGKEGDDE